MPQLFHLGVVNNSVSKLVNFSIDKHSCVREVWEETGYNVGVIRHLTTKTGTWGDWDAEVHYFLVKLIGGSKQIQDPDGLIGDIDWKSREEFELLQLQYPEDYALLTELFETKPAN